MTDESTKAEPRRIRSFVRREGRLTPGQEKALREYWPAFGLDLPADTEHLRVWLSGERPVTLEIGFGNGESLVEMAANAPERRFIGIEVHRPGVGRLLQSAHDRGLENLHVIVADAVEVLNTCIPDAGLDTVQLFFPDPWPKKRHHKRRIVQPAFIALIAQKLKPGGRFHMATDWAPYAEHMLACMEQSPDFVNTAGPGAYAPRPAHRPPTKFERRGERLGHGVWDLIFQRR